MTQDKEKKYDSTIGVKKEVVETLSLMAIDLDKGEIVERLVNGLFSAYEKQIKLQIENLIKNGKAHEILKTCFMFEVDAFGKILVAPKLKVKERKKGERFKP